MYARGMDVRAKIALGLGGLAALGALAWAASRNRSPAGMRGPVEDEDDKILASFARGDKKYSPLQRARLGYEAVAILRERGIDTTGADDARLVVLAREALASRGLKGARTDRAIARKSYREEETAIRAYGKRYKAARDPRLKKAIAHARREEITHAASFRPLMGKPIKPSSSTESQPGYVYHATNEERAAAIATSGLRPHGPSYGTDQDVWPDGSREKRSYWTRRAASAHYFAPEEGPAVLLRVAEGPTFKAERGTGDIVTTKTVPATQIEILTDEGWEPVKKWASEG